MKKICRKLIVPGMEMLTAMLTHSTATRKTHSSEDDYLFLLLIIVCRMSSKDECTFFIIECLWPEFFCVLTIMSMNSH